MLIRILWPYSPFELPLDFSGGGTWKADRCTDDDRPETMIFAKDVALSAAPPHRVELDAGSVTTRIYKTAKESKIRR